MSRVFVSCSYRDRAVGAELESLVRALGHEPSDDQDEAQGTAWWNEVVGRIEASDVFVAVASPAYAEAHSCRLAAKHAAATGLPVVRVDLDDKAVENCHPVVAGAMGVPFAPRDPDAVVRLAHALSGSPPDAPNGTSAPTPRTAVDDRGDPDPPEPDPPAPDGPAKGGRRLSALEVWAAVAMLLIAACLLYIGLSNHRAAEPSTGSTLPVTNSGEPTPTGTSTPATGAPTSDAAMVALLAGVDVVHSPRLPASSCQAGAEAVTCSNPAPNIRTVVLTPYSTPSELYAAYTAQVEELSDEPLAENTGNCSASETEGELGWNLDKEHTLDFSVAEQEGGGLDPASESAGRVFCTDHQKVMTMVWTTDPGLLVTVTGQPSEMVITWWSDVHLDVACASGVVGSGCSS